MVEVLSLRPFSRPRGRPLRVMARPAFKNARRNPYNSLLYGALQRLGVEVAEYASLPLLTQRWDILHVHWPESLLETGNRLQALWSERKYLWLIDRVRRRGTRLVWSVHDVKPHDLVFPEIETRFWNAFVQRLDAVIALTQAGLTLACRRMPQLSRLPAFVIPHGHYREQYPNRLGQAEARRQLAIAADATVISYFGQIRPYKNVPRLIDCVRQLAEPNLVLLVAGRLSKRADLNDELQQAAAGDPRVRLALRFIAEPEVQLFLNAADLLVFPYRDILNSGSALLGLSFDRPVLVPNLGAMAELQHVVGLDWVKTYDGELSPAALTDALAWARMPRAPHAPLQPFDWTVIAEHTRTAFADVVGSGRRRRPSVDQPTCA
jgi:glycosyltransferase involved in cell wall biosynthesis